MKKLKWLPNPKKLWKSFKRDGWKFDLPFVIVKIYGNGSLNIDTHPFLWILVVLIFQRSIENIIVFLIRLFS